MDALDSSFPGSADYEPGRSPVRDLTLLEQIEYWKARARMAEEIASKVDQLDAVLEEISENGGADAADWWKTAE